MTPPDEELRKAVALFRYGLIADVLRVPLGSREIRRALHEKAQRTYTIPGTRRTRVAVETMRDWLSLYRTGGFEALYPKTRADRGQPRRLPPEVAELLVSLKTEQPALSVNAPDWRRTRARRRSPPRPLHRAPTAPSVPRSPDGCARPSSSPCSSSTKPSTCATMSSKTSGSCATSPWTPKTACACSSSGSPSCACEPRHGRARIALPAPHRSPPPQRTRPRRARPLPHPPPASGRLRTPLVRTAAPSRHCSRARADCLGSSTALPTTP